jgi:surfeit locus 1 family protein
MIARRLLAPAIATLAGLAILISLGCWQLRRLAWKEELLAKIESRAHAPAEAVPSEAEWQELKPEDYEYRRVGVSGTFLNDDETYLFRAAANGPVYRVLTPLRLTNGATVLVDRGIVPLDLRDPTRRAAGQIEGEVQVTGLMRAPEPRNFFTPADRPDRREWYSRDPEAVAKAIDLARAAPFSIDLEAPAAPGGWPRAGATIRDIPNDHLSYALTWFGLAATLAGVFVAYAWREMGGGNRRAVADESHYG